MLLEYDVIQWHRVALSYKIASRYKYAKGARQGGTEKLAMPLTRNSQEIMSLSKYLNCGRPAEME